MLNGEINAENENCVYAEICIVIDFNVFVIGAMNVFHKLFTHLGRYLPEIQTNIITCHYFYENFRHAFYFH